MSKEQDITTIKITHSTKNRLDHLKEYKRESYNEVLEKILNILNLVGKNPTFANRALKNLDRKIKGKLRYTQKPQSPEIKPVNTEETKKQLIKPGIKQSQFSSKPKPSN